MLLKFTSPDILNTTLVNVATNERAYDIITVPLSVGGSYQVPDVLVTQPVASSSKDYLPRQESEKTFRSEEQAYPSTEKRRTRITNSTGKVIAKIEWTGRRPDIIIGDEHVGALTDLFGSTTVRFMPKILAIPTRFDTEFIWTATADSLTLFDYDAELIRGTFHQNVVRIPMGFKGLKQNETLTSLSSQVPSSCSSTSVVSDSSDSKQGRKTVKSTFIPTHVPGLGSNYLEFSSHPLAQDIEIIISFLMMEILRRGRFSLSQYEFEKPKLWQFKEARNLVMRRFRRNTI